MDLLEYRYVEQLPTFLTTNLDASEIRGKYGDRIADRFNEMLSVIIFRRVSYRT
jgi:DNA replication protein DnaC